MVKQMSLRQRNRRQAMRLVQTTAVEMFEADGYHATTVEAIAGACGVSASTIYRHFGTKEHIVLWDERDVVINAELDRRLRTDSPLRAFRDAAIAAFAERDDTTLFLRRLKLTYAEPAIWAEAAQQHRAEQAELAEGLAALAGSKTIGTAHDVTAAACLAALEVALDHWQRDDGTQDLAALIAQTCDQAAALR
jgi:AcrR family transcriptional regulator